jgi:hypothetical protein
MRGEESTGYDVTFLHTVCNVTVRYVFQFPDCQRIQCESVGGFLMAVLMSRSFQTFSLITDVRKQSRHLFYYYFSSDRFALFLDGLLFEDNLESIFQHLKEVECTVFNAQ